MEVFSRSSYIFWILICINGSLSWSSTINSLFSSKATLSIKEHLHPMIIDVIANGVQMAMDECRTTFKWDQWNCPQSSFSRQNKQLLTKERAYVEAILAAGVIYSITKNCTNGELENCGCKNIVSNRNVNVSSGVDWIWDGCSADTKYAEDMVAKYFENEEKNWDIQAFINRHNNKIGREIVRDTLKKYCKCHGVSGACSLQTCWMQLIPFSVIAQKLRKKYDNALQLSYNSSPGVHLFGNSIRQDSQEKLSNLFSANLLYLEESPDYCLKNYKTGWPGTKGRICSKTSNTTNRLEEKSCKNLCRACGFQVRKEKKINLHKCNCSFNWCCEVKCDICTEHTNYYFCA